MNTSNLSQTAPHVAVPSLPLSHSILSLALHCVKIFLTYALLTSLQAVLQLLRTFSALPQDSIRVFAASSKEDLNEQLKRQNTNLTTNSVTATQFLQGRNLAVREQTRSAPAQRIPSQADQPEESVAAWAKELWDKHTAMRRAQGAQQASAVVTFSPLPDSLTGTGVPPSLGMSLLDTKRLQLERGKGGDHDTPYRFTHPTSVKEQLAWAQLHTRVQAGELPS
jgi:hypothetical protein